jgi:molybdopterin molybdotransferase
MTEVSSPSSLLAIEDALSCIAAHVTPLALERVVLEDAYGRFLAEDLCAPLDLPPFRNSSMDGYAVRAVDTPGRLTVLGESAAGAPHRAAVVAGVAVKVSTGAAMPDGTGPRQRHRPRCSAARRPLPPVAARGDRHHRQ